MKVLKFQSSSLIIILIFIVLFNAQSDAADSLKYIAHSFLKIKTDKGMVIYVDPALTNSFGDSADVVLSSHDDSDHNELFRVKMKQSCTVIRAADALKSGVYQNFKIGDITINAVPSYNSKHSKNSCVGYVIAIPTSEGDTIKLYHPGDSGKIPEMADLANQNITYAFLPMDGTYTMTPQAATEAAAMINAKHDIPIHTMPGIPGYNDTKVSLFTSPNKMVLKPGATIALTNKATSIQEGSNQQPRSFDLFQNYPNPFNPQTVIPYKLSESSHVQLKVFDPLGREIIMLVDREQSAGNYTVNFDADKLASGVYIYKFTAGNFSATKKMILNR